MPTRKLSIDKLSDEDRYEVDLKRPIRVGRSWVRPGQRVELKGRVIKDNADDVEAVRPLAD